MLFTPLIAFAAYASAAPTRASSLTTDTALTSVSTPVTSSTTAGAALPSPTVPYASDDPNGSYLNRFQSGTPEPERGAAGGSIMGPQNLPLERQNPDLLAPPTTDSGTVENVKWPFGLSHNRVQDGGWARQQNIHEMPIATSMAGVDMRLNAGAIRELHWHLTAEWGYVMAGSCRVNAVDQLGRNYLADVYPGDLWYFPQGIPHSIQGLNDTANGCEFLLVLDDGTFSEDSTFLLTDWMAHIPKDVLAKNFRVNASAFDHIPDRQLWMLPSAVPTESVTEANPVSPAGTVPLPFTFAASKAPATNVTGGSVKVIDSRTFNISKTIAVAEVTVVPGGIRELHWHPTQPEWTFYLEGNARVTVFASSANARTFDYQAGDIGYVPPTFGHYVENIGNTTMRYLEIFKTNIYEDISLNQWLALTPPELVKAHLQLDDETISLLQKVKPIVVGPGEWSCRSAFFNVRTNLALNLANDRAVNVYFAEIDDWVRKKCDEAKPQCSRCVGTSTPCVYEYIEHAGPGNKRIKRTKPARRSASELASRTSRNTSVRQLDDIAASLLFPPISEDSVVLAQSISPEAWGIGSDLTPSPLALAETADYPYMPQPSISPTPSQPLSDLSLTTLSSTSDHAWVASGVPYTYPIVPTVPSSISQVWSDYDESEIDEEGDPEGVGLILCTNPTMDKNVKDNALPFVLECYSRWAIARVYEPLKVVHAMRDQVIQQFASDNGRKRTIMIANVMKMFGQDLVIDGRGQFILNCLASDVQEKSIAFMKTPPLFDIAMDRRNAMRALDSVLEILALQVNTQPIAACIRSLDNAAPIFRRACIEPPGQPLNLPNIMMEHSLNLRHFATIDIVRSVSTGQPTYFRYEVPFSLELCEKMYQMQDVSGLQWLYGFPDQFVMLFAWIHCLCEKPGGNVSELIAWVESILPQIKIAVGEFGDPLLRIGRMVVQDCWRYAVRIYLYMVLGGANALDPRVMRVQKDFMRLLRGVKPARNPDAFLMSPIIIAGVATLKERDRHTLRRRMLNVRECAEPGTSGNDGMLQLEDVWARTKVEGRPAVWSDLGIAVRRVTGR
ncbi:oxalate decarboxylase [Rhizoctonia solani]|uniref:Oxalate decarboxylase n=1 Tax=Rhizoctonia solani TaxID=456999 RepID=A0A8H8P1K7_9AGAM|nr:oxalate decarboxylase [Rhizoctonia solani]QRW22657.1 oxalate decarboxylase [Rhizoctonia solani]